MLSRLRNMFRVPDLRNKILFTIFIIAVYRVGAHLPVPYVQFSAIKQLQHTASSGGVVGFLDLFSGGAITSVAIFFLGIMPYITASIIMQLLGVVIPKLEEWQNEGQTGQKKITQWTRYLTVALALMQSTDGIKGRRHRAFLPASDIGGVLARQRDASIDRAQIVVVLRASLLAPRAEATHREWRAMPRHGDAVIELLLVLGMNPTAVIQSVPHAFVRRHGGELHGIRTPDIGAQQHAFAAAVKSGVRVADGGDG